MYGPTSTCAINTAEGKWKLFIYLLLLLLLLLLLKMMRYSVSDTAILGKKVI